MPGPPSGPPGLGPHRRAVVTRGRLLVREPDGTVRDLLPEGSRPWDASDPAVSPDGSRVAFAAVFSPGSRWRIWVAGADGSGVRALDVEPAGPARQFDDLDPCWIDGRTIVFASTREGRRAACAAVPVTNLYSVDADDPAEPRRLTSEPDGGEEPAWDARRRRIVYARWAGPTAADSCGPWQTATIDRDGAPAEPTDRGPSGAEGAYQPAVLAGGAIAGVSAAHPALTPDPGALGIRVHPGSRPPRWLAGARPGAAAAAAAPASACSPAAAPGGTVLFAGDTGGRGDFGVWSVGPDARPSLVVDLPGTLELDPVALAPAARVDAPR